MPSVQKPETTGRKITGAKITGSKITGLRIRDPQDRAALLQSARDFHVQWKPYFDGLYGPRTPHWQAPHWQAGSPAWKLDADNPRLVSLVDQARRLELAETAGTFGITTAIFGLVWMAGKCGPALLPVLFG